MANEVHIPTLTEALASIGNAHVYRGDFFTANSVEGMGQKEGDIEVGGGQQWNPLRAPELTGDMVHDELLMGEDLVLTVPMVVPEDGSFWAAHSPTGIAGGGYSNPQRPTDTSVAVIPDWEVGGGLKYAAATWERLAGNGITALSGAGAEPKNALWIWRARISYGTPRFSIQNGGKMIVPVTIQAKYATQAGVPEGQKLYSWGDPVTNGVTGFLFSAPT